MAGNFHLRSRLSSAGVKSQSMPQLPSILESPDVTPSRTPVHLRKSSEPCYEWRLPRNFKPYHSSCDESPDLPRLPAPVPLEKTSERYYEHALPQDLTPNHSSSYTSEERSSPFEYCSSSDYSARTNDTSIHGGYSYLAGDKNTSSLLLHVDHRLNTALIERFRAVVQENWDIFSLPLHAPFTVLATLADELDQFTRREEITVIARHDRRCVEQVVVRSLRQYLNIFGLPDADARYSFDDWRKAIRASIEALLGGNTLHLGSVAQHARERRQHGRCPSSRVQSQSLGPPTTRFVPPAMGYEQFGCGHAPHLAGTLCPPPLQQALSPASPADAAFFRESVLSIVQSSNGSPVEPDFLRRLSKASSGITSMVARTVGGVILDENESPSVLVPAIRFSGGDSDGDEGGVGVGERKTVAW